METKKATQYEPGWLKAYYITQEIKPFYDSVKRESDVLNSAES